MERCIQMFHPAVQAEPRSGCPSGGWWLLCSIFFYPLRPVWTAENSIQALLGTFLAWTFPGKSALGVASTQPPMTIWMGLTGVNRGHSKAMARVITPWVCYHIKAMHFWGTKYWLFAISNIQYPTTKMLLWDGYKVDGKPIWPLVHKNY